MDDSAQQNNQQSGSAPVDTSLGDGMSAPPIPTGMDMTQPTAQPQPSMPTQPEPSAQSSAPTGSVAPAPAMPEPVADATGGNQPTVTEAPPPPGDGQTITTFKPIRGKFGPKGIIATVFGILVLVAATIVGITQVGQTQIFREKAAQCSATNPVDCDGVQGCHWVGDTANGSCTVLNVPTCNNTGVYCVPDHQISSACVGDQVCETWQGEMGFNTSGAGTTCSCPGDYPSSTDGNHCISAQTCTPSGDFLASKCRPATAADNCTASPNPSASGRASGCDDSGGFFCGGQNQCPAPCEWEADGGYLCVQDPGGPTETQLGGCSCPAGTCKTGGGGGGGKRQCAAVGLQVYSRHRRAGRNILEWHDASIQEAAALKAGDNIRFTAAGEGAKFDNFTKARFSVNGGGWVETGNFEEKISPTLGVTLSKYFVWNYTIPAGVTHFEVKGNIWYERGSKWL